MQYGIERWSTKRITTSDRHCTGIVTIDKYQGGESKNQWQAKVNDQHRKHMYCITVQHKVTVKQNVQYCSIHVCAYLYTSTGTCFVNRNSKVKNTDVTLRRRTCADAQRCRVYSTSQGSKRGLYRGLYTVRGRTVHGLALSVPKSSTIDFLACFLFCF